MLRISIEFAENGIKKILNGLNQTVFSLRIFNLQLYSFLVFHLSENFSYNISKIIRLRFIRIYFKWFIFNFGLKRKLPIRHISNSELSYLFEVILTWACYSSFKIFMLRELSAIWLTTSLVSFEQPGEKQQVTPWFRTMQV